MVFPILWESSKNILGCHTLRFDHEYQNYASIRVFQMFLQEFKVLRQFLRFRFRSSRPEVFYKKGVLKNFAKFTGKHLRQSLFYRTPLVAADLVFGKMHFFKIVKDLVTVLLKMTLFICIQLFIHENPIKPDCHIKLHGVYIF